MSTTYLFIVLSMLKGMFSIFVSVLLVNFRMDRLPLRIDYRRAMASSDSMRGFEVAALAHISVSNIYARRLNDWSSGNAPIVDTEAIEDESTRDSDESIQPDYEKIFKQLEIELKKNLSSFLDDSDE